MKLGENPDRYSEKDYYDKYFYSSFDFRLSRPEPEEKPLPKLVFSKNGKELGFNGHYTETIKLLDARPKIKANAQKQKEVVYTEGQGLGDLGWRGGTVEDAKEVKDIEPFLRAKRELEKSGFQRRINPRWATSPKRQRLRSEHDGDFNFDSKWDIKPFDTALKRKVPIPEVHVVADFSFNCNFEAELINKYGAFVWSICQILETAGVAVEASIRLRSVGVSSDGDFNSTALIKVKESSEYISPIAMAMCFRTVFYRRVLFNLYIMMCDIHDVEVCSSLGRGTPYEKSAQYKDGVLKLSIGAASDVGAVEKELLKILEPEEGVKK